jgi:hypothetical protein
MEHHGANIVLLRAEIDFGGGGVDSPPGGIGINVENAPFRFPAFGDEQRKRSLPGSGTTILALSPAASAPLGPTSRTIRKTMENQNNKSGNLPVREENPVAIFIRHTSPAL